MKFISRRLMIKGTSAIVAASVMTTPLAAETIQKACYPKIDPKRQIEIKRIKDYFTEFADNYYGPTKESYRDMMVNICHRMVDLDPDIFNHFLISKQDSSDYSIVSRNINYEFKVDLQKNNEDYIAINLLQELRKSMQIHNMGFIYIPAIPVKIIDPVTFQPKIGFKFIVAPGAYYDIEIDKTVYVEDARIYHKSQEFYKYSQTL